MTIGIGKWNFGSTRRPTPVMLQTYNTGLSLKWVYNAEPPALWWQGVAHIIRLIYLLFAVSCHFYKITHQRKVILGPFLLQFHFRRSTVILLPRCHANDTLCSSWLITVRFCFSNYSVGLCVWDCEYLLYRVYTPVPRDDENDNMNLLPWDIKTSVSCTAARQWRQRLQKHTGTQDQC